MTRAWTLLLAMLAASACSQQQPPLPLPSPSGPPRVQGDVVDAHAEQFDRDAPDRPAGSQQELAAATYLLGHLQQAAYAVRLDRIPVGDLVTSTNVVTTTTRDEPEAVVVAPYDTGSGAASSGRSLGFFLELARALRAANAEHDVGFAALGAEHATVRGGRLGSRRLAQQLRDAGADARVYVLGDAVSTADVFEAAGFDVTLVPLRAASDANALLRRLIAEHG